MLLSFKSLTIRGVDQAVLVSELCLGWTGGQWSLKAAEDGIVWFNLGPCAREDVQKGGMLWVEN